jgi:hypothetical protein
VAKLKQLAETPHAAKHSENRSTAIDRRTTPRRGYQVSQWMSKLIEHVFGWLKTVGLVRKTGQRGALRVGRIVTFCLGASDLMRIRNLEATTE